MWAKEDDADDIATFRELGPPDLCQVIKSSGSKAAQRDVSLALLLLTYAFTDILSWDLIIIGTSWGLYRMNEAILTTQTAREWKLHLQPRLLRTSIPYNSQLKTPKPGSQARVQDGGSGAVHTGQYSRLAQVVNIAYMWGSCFNAFSRVDMRVDVRIPGGVDAYIVDPRGEK